MNYINSANWAGHMPYPTHNLLPQYYSSQIPFCMALYPNFQNQFLPNAQLLTSSNQNAFRTPAQAPQNSRTKQDRRERCNLPSLPNRKTKKIRNVKRVRAIKDHPMLRECLEPSKNDRNIQSNALKLFLKYLRTDSKFSVSLIRKIIKSNNLTYDPDQFIQDLNKAISPALNYIRPLQIKEICQSTLQQNFSLVFRTSLKEFFTTEIHLMSTKPIRTNRFVRGEQIKAGRKILNIVFSH